MGSVFVAEQLEPVRRRVALKVIKQGMDTRAVVARFEAERQALALMDHPNIAKVLDAGCGTGTLTMALLRNLRVPVRITAVDLSASVISTAKKYVAKSNPNEQEVRFAQGNVLTLPFAEETFDLVVTSGVMEYVPLDEGFTELARVMSRGGYLLNLPIRPSLASKVLEVLFRFKAHPPEEVSEATDRHFTLVSHYRFPPLQVISWSKTAVLAQKV